MHPVVYPGFKPGKGRQPLLGRFDSCCFPPFSYLNNSYQRTCLKG